MNRLGGGDNPAPAEGVRRWCFGWPGAWMRSAAAPSAPSQVTGLDDELPGGAVTSGLEEAIGGKRGDDAAGAVNVRTATAGAYDGLGSHVVPVGRRGPVLHKKWPRRSGRSVRVASCGRNAALRSPRFRGMAPRPLSRGDAATLETLVEGLADPTESDEPSSRRLGEKGDSGTMPLSIERLATHMYSLTHYYKLNGDMMRDPDVVFFRDAEGRWFPAIFQQDGACPIYTVALELSASGITGVDRRRYADLREFARWWLANLRVQHGIQ